MLQIPLLHLGGQFAQSFFDNVFRDLALPTRGSVVYCDLALSTAEHTGIYVGDNKIVHLDGSGLIEVVTPEKFLQRLGGWNTAMSIYISCHGKHAVGSDRVAARALSMVNRRRRYNVIFDNCHQFTTGCLTGDFDTNGCNYLWMVKSTAKEVLGASTWRVWETKDAKYVLPTT